MRFVPLGDLCHITIGRTPSRANPDYWGGPNLWATISDLSDGRLRTTRESITHRAIIETRMQPVEPGTLLYSFKLTIGKMAVTAVPLFTNEAIASLVPRDPASLDVDYLRYALASLDAGASASTAVKGRTLNTASLSGLPVPLVPLAEQRRICAQLDQQAALVAEARAASIERVAKLRRLTEKCLASRIMTESESGWAETQLKNVVEIQLGKMLSPASKTGRRPVPYLRNANVQWDRFDLSDVYEMDFTEAEERKFRLEAGDVLVCEGGQPGRAAIWEGQIERCCYQKSLHRIRPIANAVDPRFLMYRLWLGALHGEFVDNHAATTIAHLPAIRLAGLQIRLPGVDARGELRGRFARNSPRLIR